MIPEQVAIIRDFLLENFDTTETAALNRAYELWKELEELKKDNSLKPGCV